MVSVSVVATTVERLTGTLANIVGSSRDRPGSPAEHDGRIWNCDACGSVHTGDPDRCEACGSTVLSPHRTGDPPARENRRDRSADWAGAAGPEAAGNDPVWACIECGGVHAENPERCRDCGYTVFTWRLSRDQPVAVARDDGPGQSVTTTIVERIAERDGVDPADLRPLHDVVDTDALDALVEASERATVTFPYCGYTVTVDPEGTVRFRDAA